MVFAYAAALLAATTGSLIAQAIGDGARPQNGPYPTPGTSAPPATAGPAPTVPATYAPRKEETTYAGFVVYEFSDFIRLSDGRVLLPDEALRKTYPHPLAHGTLIVVTGEPTAPFGGHETIKIKTLRIVKDAEQR